MKNQFSNFWFLRYNRFCTNIQEKCMLGGLQPHKPSVFVESFPPHTSRRRLRPQAPDALGLNLPGQLVVSLASSSESGSQNSRSPQFIVNHC